MIDTLPELFDYLNDRGARYGISGEELYKAIPESAQEPSRAYEFMQMKDISHKVPLSEGGHPASDNWILEDSSVNRARGAETMTPEEERTAKADAVDDAENIRVADLAKMAMVGGALTSGGAIVEGAIVAGEIASAAAVETVAASFITTVVVPVVVTTAIVGGIGYGGYRLFKRLSK